MAQGDYEAAYERLSPADQRALSREEFVARYRALEKLPWVAAVLRSARAEGDRLTALDWTHTRLAGSRILANPVRLAAIPRRRYLGRARIRGDKLVLGLEGSARRAGAVSLGATSHDWFALYAALSGRCPVGATHLVVELTAGEARAGAALACGLWRGRDEVVVWLDVGPREYRGSPIEARLVGVVRGPLDLFRAPDPALVGSPGFPLAVN
jgi:hypothetical protein